MDILNNYKASSVRHIEVKSEFSLLENYVLKQSHPRAIFLNMTGLLWFFYFLWNHNWQLSIGVMIITRLLSYLAVLDVNPIRMSETLLGRIGLLHLHLLNAVTQIFGSGIILYGVWFHSLEFTLLGFSTILLGHLFDWEKVSPEF